MIAFLTEPASIERIPTHLGEPTMPPAITPARAPPHSKADDDQRPAWDVARAEPAPEINFDQSQGW